MQVFIKG